MPCRKGIVRLSPFLGNGCLVSVLRKCLRIGLFAGLVVFGALCLVGPVHAEGPSLTLDLGQGGPKQTAVVLQILALLTVLTLATTISTMRNGM